MADEKKKKEETPEDDGLISGEEIQATVIDDGLDLDIVDEFDESDFDEEFDDDFEEEIEGEYDLEDDKYGKEFEENFGHLTDPTKAKKKAPAPAGKKDPKAPLDSKVKPDAKAAAKKAPAKTAKKKPARKK